VAGRDGVGRVFLSGIARDAKGTPVRLTPPLRLAPALVAVQGGAWVDDDQVVVLGRDRSGPVQPWVLQIGGPASATTPTSSSLPPNLTTVTAGNGELDLYLGTVGGEVLSRAGAGWVPIASGKWPTFPG
jgi:hypothetical protein